MRSRVASFSLICAVVALPAVGQYCAPGIVNACSGVAPPGYSLYESISNVTIGSINNTSGCTLSPAYTDYTGIGAASLQQGVANPVSVTMANWWAGDTIEIYCDWNGDGTFQVPGEETILNDPGTIVASSGYSYQTYTGSIMPPVGAVAATRMRVVLRFNSGFDVPCPTTATSTYGEVEDYAITTFFGVIPCTLAFSSPGIGTNIKMDNTPCPQLAGAAYLNAITSAAGVFPAGWFHGLDISLPELINEYNFGFPFKGLLDGSGASTFSTSLPPGFSGVPIWAVSTQWAPGFTTFVYARPQVTYVIP